MSNYNLDVSTPDEVPAVLETAADHFRQSAADLAANWQDRDAGRCWEDFAKILDKAAIAARKVLRNRVLLV